MALASLIVIFYFWRRRRHGHASGKERPLDLLHDPSDGGHDGVDDADGGLPQYYQPEPFILPDPTAPSTVGGDDAGGLRPSTDRRQSRLSATSMSSSAQMLEVGTASGSGAGVSARKSPAPPTFRPVNIIQHDDAGPQEQETQQEPETIELPPAYNKIRGAPSVVDVEPPASSVGEAEAGRTEEHAEPHATEAPLQESSPQAVAAA